MLLFYYGTDTGRMREAVHTLADRYRTKHRQTNLFLCDASQVLGRDQLEQALKHQTFFREPTFVAASHVFSHDSASKRATELLNDESIISDSDIVFLLHQEGDEAGLKKKNKALLKLLMEKAKSIEVFAPLHGRQLTAWMQRFCKNRNCELTAPVAGHLVARIGSDSWTLTNELAKICAWTGSGTIERQTIDRLVVSPQAESDVFALTDAVARRNKRSILTTLNAQLASGADPHYILSMYTFAIRNILTIKDLAEQGMSQASIAKTGGLHPFVVKKGMAGAQAYQKNELIRAHHWLAQADQATKNGSWDPRDTVYDFILSAI